MTSAEVREPHPVGATLVGHTDRVYLVLVVIGTKQCENLESNGCLAGIKKDNLCQNVSLVRLVDLV